METFSTLLALCKGNPSVTGGFPLQRPVTRIFDVFFDLSLNKRLGKQSRRRWFETQSRSSWRHWNSTKNCFVANIMKFYVLTTNNRTLALRVCGDENTSITPNHSRHPLPWRHKSVMAYQVTSHFTSRQFVQRLINFNNKATIVVDPHYWSTANLWIPLKPLVFPSQRAGDAYPHKGSVMWKAFPCHDVVMSHEDAGVWWLFAFYDVTLYGGNYAHFPMGGWFLDFRPQLSRHLVATPWNASVCCVAKCRKYPIGNLTLEVPRDFPRTGRPFWMMLSDPWR